MTTRVTPTCCWPGLLARFGSAATVVVAVASCAATAHHTAREPTRAAAEQPTPLTSRPVVTLPAEHGTVAITPSTFATYLETVALALASPDASAPSVLRAARARGVEVRTDLTRFRAPDSRVADAFVRLPEAEADPHPQSITFRFDAQGAPVTLAELAAAFGAWTDDVPTITLADPYQVAFTTPLPASEVQKRRRGPLTFVNVSLSDAPSRPGARVRQVLFRRFSVDP